MCLQARERQVTKGHHLIKKEASLLNMPIGLPHITQWSQAGLQWGPHGEDCGHTILSNRTCYTFFILLKNFLKYLYIFKTERHRAQVGERQREGDIESEIGSQLRAVKHRARHGARTHELWDYDLSWSWTLNNWATQAPRTCCTFK